MPVASSNYLLHGIHFENSTFVIVAHKSAHHFTRKPLETSAHTSEGEPLINLVRGINYYVIEYVIYDISYKLDFFPKGPLSFNTEGRLTNARLKF